VTVSRRGEAFTIDLSRGIFDGQRGGHDERPADEEENAPDRHDRPQNPHSRQGQRRQAAAEDQRADEKAPAGGLQQAAHRRHLRQGRRHREHQDREGMVETVANGCFPVVTPAGGIEQSFQPVGAK
jgi:hypothetical protein